MTQISPVGATPAINHNTAPKTPPQWFANMDPKNQEQMTHNLVMACFYDLQRMQNLRG